MVIVHLASVFLLFEVVRRYGQAAEVRDAAAKANASRPGPALTVAPS